MRSTTSSNVASWRGHSSVAHEHHSVLGMSPARMAARVRANTVPGQSSLGGVPVYMIWRSPVADAASVYMMASYWESVSSCASSNTTSWMSSKPRALPLVRAENSMEPPLVR